MLDKYVFITIILILFSNFTAVNSQTDIGKRESSTKSYQKGVRLFKNYKYSEALEYFNNCYSINKNEKKCLLKLAECNYRLGNYTKAKNNFKHLVSIDSTDIFSLNQLALIYNYESNYRKAIMYYEDIIKIDSTNSYYYTQLGQLYKRAENVPVSVEYYNKALQINPKNTQVINELANFYLNIGLFAKADSFVNDGIIIDSTNIRLLTTRTKILYRQQKYDKAVKQINSILDQTKDTSSLLLRLLAISTFNLKEYKFAIVLLEKIVSQKEESEVIYYFLGKSYLEAGENKKSVFYFNKALEEGISGNVSTYYFNIAYIQEKQGKYLKAAKNFKEAYHYSKEKILLYKIAKNYDMAFKDKKPALNYYKKYIKQNDSENKELLGYAKTRVIEIKEFLHFSKK